MRLWRYSKIKKILFSGCLGRLVRSMRLLQSHAMKSFAPFALGCGLVVLSASGAQAETWIARCNNLQFNFDRKLDYLTVSAKSTEGMNREARQFLNTHNGFMIHSVFQGKIFSKSADGVSASIPISNPQPGSGINDLQVFPRLTLTKSSNTLSFAIKKDGKLMSFKFCTSSPPVQVVR